MTATNPTLTRTENGIDNPIASQIIGFKIGASTVTLNGTNITGSSGSLLLQRAVSDLALATTTNSTRFARSASR